MDRTSNSNSHELLMPKQMVNEKGVTLSGVLPAPTAVQALSMCKEASFYTTASSGSHKENNGATALTNNYIGGTNDLNGHHSHHHNSRENHLSQQLNSNQVDASSLINSFYANNSTISTISAATGATAATTATMTQPVTLIAAQQQKFRSSALTNNSIGSQPQSQPQQPQQQQQKQTRGILSSKQMNNQIQIINHHGDVNNGNSVKKEDCLTSTGKLIFL